MMTTLRGTLIRSPRLYDAGCVPGDPGWELHAEDGPELSEVADLVVRARDTVGERLGVAIHPGDGHPHPLRAHDVDVRAVTHEQPLRRHHPDPPERHLEDLAARPAPPDLVPHHEPAGEIRHARPAQPPNARA